MSARLTDVLGQPSWTVENDAVRAHVTEIGAQLAPVTFRLGDRDIEPYHVAPWAEEDVSDQPPMLRALRGDFFCAPFGGNGTAFQGESHPPHGESANEKWTLIDKTREGDRTTLALALDTKVRPGRINRSVTLIDSHSAVYQRTILSGMTGPMTVGHHAMLRFPDREGAGLVATSPFVWARTSPVVIESPESNGDSSLAVDAPFEDLDAVPSAAGGTADLSRFPARPGFEDLVMVAADPAADFACTAVTFPVERYVWFSLKNPRVLRQTIFWLSNGGRRYAPWSGRHVNVMGFEEVTSYFHFGLAESVAPNPLSEHGIPTFVDLDGSDHAVSTIAGVAAIPDGFDRVDKIVAGADGTSITLTSRSGQGVEIPIRLAFLES